MQAANGGFDPTVRRVIVGFDGSEGAGDALRWAHAEAERWSCPLVVLRTWEFTPLLAATNAPTDLDELASRVAEHASTEIEEVLGVAPSSDGPVHLAVVEGAPAHVLTEMGGPGDLIVVGSRGLGGFKELLLGSVSRQVSLHARCPVVIIRRP